eukprot:jgi/Bigna1/80707/fgenesh1_pg.73_\
MISGDSPADDERENKFCTRQWFLVVISGLAFSQAILVGGVFPSVVSTLERRYGLNSVRTGIIATTYDVGVFSSSFIYGYLATGGHRPRLMGIGGIFLGVGAFLFGLPQLATGRYEFVDRSETDLCGDGLVPPETCGSISGGVYGLFVIAVILVALGSAPLWAVGPAHLDYIVPPLFLPSYLSIFYVIVGIGTAIGFLFASFTLSIWVDPGVEPSNLEPEDDNWVGAWWIAWFVVSGFLFLWATPMLMFHRGNPHTPSTITETQDSNEEDNIPMNKGECNHNTSDGKNDLNQVDDKSAISDKFHEKNTNIDIAAAVSTALTTTTTTTSTPSEILKNPGTVTTGSCLNDDSNKTTNTNRNSDLTATRLLLQKSSTAPNSTRAHMKDKDKMSTENFEVKDGSISSLESEKPSAPPPLSSLLKPIFSLSYIAFIMGTVTETFAVSGFGVFIPKVVESSFALSSSHSLIQVNILNRAALFVGIVIVPGVAGGIYFGGWLSKRLRLSPRQNAKMSWIVALAALPLMPTFFIGCDPFPLAGVSVRYNPENNNNEIIAGMGVNLDSQCNLGCGCSRTPYSPVCGPGGINYFSSCYAGCQSRISGDTSGNCTCTAAMPSIITPAMLESQAVTDGKCDQGCSGRLGAFLILFLLIMFATFTNNIPAAVVSLKMLPEESRPLGVSFQQVVTRIFGSIPAPLIFGAVIDSSWYNSEQFQLNLFLLAFLPKLLSFVFFFVGWWTFPNTPTSDVRPDYENEEEKLQKIHKENSLAVKETKIQMKPLKRNDTDEDAGDKLEGDDTKSKVTELHSYKESSVSKLIDTEISAENLMKNKDVVSV